MTELEQLCQSTHIGIDGIAELRTCFLISGDRPRRREDRRLTDHPRAGNERQKSQAVAPKRRAITPKPSGRRAPGLLLGHDPSQGWSWEREALDRRERRRFVDCRGTSLSATLEDLNPRQTAVAVALPSWQLPNRQSMDGQAMAAGWSSLPNDIINHIADLFLDTNDLDWYMDLRAVCSGWRSATADPKNTPGDPSFQPRRWAMIDEVHQSDALLFVNADTGRFVRKDLPLLRRGNGSYILVAGAPDGWLVLSERTPAPAGRARAQPFHRRRDPFRGAHASRAGGRCARYHRHFGFAADTCAALWLWQRELRSV
ncbi:hypothetical protein ACP70R_006087 [Stipagrostis hirtigluma subsp. patula]